MTFIKKLTASSSGTLSFVNGASSVVLDNTYKEYLFTFNNIHAFVAGYFNTTTALTTVQFKFNTGNIDAGDICLYGIS